MASWKNFELRVYDIVKYVGSHKRSMILGDQLLNSNHVMLCGTLEISEHKILITGLCLQTSNEEGIPHEVRVTIDRERNLHCTCNCKAGKSGKCEHVVAVLLNVNRVDIANLEDLSSIGFQQQWEKLKNDTKKTPEVIPFSQFCCVNKPSSSRDTSIILPDDFSSADVAAKLIAGAEGSEAALFEKGRGTLQLHQNTGAS